MAEFKIWLAMILSIHSESSGSVYVSQFLVGMSVRKANRDVYIADTDGQKDFFFVENYNLSS